VFGMPKPAETDTQRDAREFLRELMVAGEPMRANDIYAAGKKEGFSPKQLRRAAKAERGRFHKISMKEGWEWTLPF